MDADSPLPGPSKESRRGAQKGPAPRSWCQCAYRSIHAGWHGKTVREVSWVVLHDKRQAKREEHAGKDRVAQPAAPPEPVATVGRKGVVVKPARVPGKKGVRESQQAAAEKKASEWTVVEPKKRRPRGGPVQFEERYTVVNKSLRGAHPSR